MKRTFNQGLLNARTGIHIAFYLVVFQIGAHAQMITGNWSGKINRQKVELKIIQKGDSLTGTSYYYESANNYRRYSLKGYFNTETNEAVWWDDQLLEEKMQGVNLGGPGKNALLSSADFNCPGDGTMKLEGESALIRENGNRPRGPVHLDKVAAAIFNDEWNYVIDNFTSGTNDPEIIDSVELIAITDQQRKEPPVTERPVEKPVTIEPPVEQPVSKPAVSKPVPVQDNKTIVIQQKPAAPAPAIINPPILPKPDIQEKFTTRRKVLNLEIPVSGDSIELRFYDNAEIDGDSISLFLNDRLIFEHIRLLGTAYTIKIPTTDLKDTNELTMVAENLGSIPPNTSYMVALVDGKRYEARLESTEGSSAMIRLTKTPHIPN